MRFIDIAQFDFNDPTDVLEHWRSNGRTTEALIGVSQEGHFSLDLARDGPHALVAGTTGAGKSEFLQTLVASLALANRPEALNFVLVDYKGASAFADCERLPHTVGMVTNLDGHLTERALVSLDAELRRREHQLKLLGTPDIDAAWDRDPRGASEARLARLVLVIDEFAELVHELPEFITGLIRIARVGRSLGVHLILATQRPAGVVTPEMKANTGLRVALRMEDKADSVEVLDSPLAATITRATPGRGFVRSGATSLLREFQTARIGGRQRGNTSDLPPVRCAAVAWGQIGMPSQLPANEQVPSRSASDLHGLTELLINAAIALDCDEPQRPWLPPLPETVLLDELGSPPPVAGEVVPVPIGLEDIPSQQTQRLYQYDLKTTGHLSISGGARTGRSTTLQALAGAIANVTQSGRREHLCIRFWKWGVAAIGGSTAFGRRCWWHRR